MTKATECRNFVIAGHAGSGKSTLSELMLYKAGAIGRPGTVDAKNTVSDFMADEQERRASIADAAMAAVRMMIGDLGAGDIVPGLAERALDRMGEDSRYSVEVAPSHVEAVTARLAGREGVAVEANPALGPLDCVVRTSTGRVIANLDTQIETLAQRWGVGEAAPSDIAPVANGNHPA